MARPPSTGTPKRDGDRTKNAILELVAKGHSIEKACEAAGVKRTTYNYHRSVDATFAARMDRLTSRQKNDAKVTASGEHHDADRASAVPDFPEFCDMLGMPLYLHQLQWFDLLEGRTPRDLDESMVFEPGDPDLLVVNTPPFHAKSMTLTINYTSWRIYKDPNVRIIIVSKAQRLAEQFLGAIKQRLTHPSFEALWTEHGPPGGWDTNSQSWKQNLFFVSDDVRDPEEKDPTCQALGIGGAIYGARADLIILDDCVDNGNAHEYDKQNHWIETEVLSRVPDGGKLLVIGTRMAPKDLYSELRNPAKGEYAEEEAEEADKWTYFAQPAVLRFAEKPEDWETLWPRTTRASGKKDIQHADGTYAMWDGPKLRKRRAHMDPARWSRVFMQQSVAEDQTFQPNDIEACQQPRRPGIIPNDPRLGRDGGMDGLYVLAGLDPAAAGCTAMTVYGVDRTTGLRHVIDVYNQARTTNEQMEFTIKDFTERYNINEWRVEGNAFQSHLVNDIALNQWMAARGTKFEGHTTGKNKHDVDLGVAAMSALFRSRMITLPRSSTEAIRAMVEQLSTWAPKLPKGHKTDVVMSLWFAELRAQELIVRGQQSQTFAPNPFLTRWDSQQRHVIDLSNPEPAAASGWWN